MGPKLINDLTMLATMLSAEEAKRLGIVNRVVPREKLDDAAMQMANILLLKNPWALARIKWLNYRQASHSVSDALDLGNDQVAIWAQLPDVIEGLSAFLQRRKPNYEQFKEKTKHVLPG
jgi:enoyl-CoA hydratase/carnithine racemase